MKVENMNPKDYIDILIQQQWDKEVTNASDAHFRAQELTRLQKIKENYANTNSKTQDIL